MKKRLLATLLSAAMLGLPTAATVLGTASPVSAAAPTSPTDETKVPHYFGPYPNWANSPQVLADAIVTIGLGTPTPVSFGNPLTARAPTPPTTPPRREFSARSSWSSPAPCCRPACSRASRPGTRRSRPGAQRGRPADSSTRTSCGRPAHPASTRSSMTVAAHRSDRPAAVCRVATFPVTPAVAVQAGDVLGFYGQGIPVDTGVTVEPGHPQLPRSTRRPPLRQHARLGDPGFPMFSQDRTYSFSAIRHSRPSPTQDRRRGDRHGRSEDGRHLRDHRHRARRRLRLRRRRRSRSAGSRRPRRPARPPSSPRASSTASP